VGFVPRWPLCSALQLPHRELSVVGCSSLFSGRGDTATSTARSPCATSRSRPRGRDLFSHSFRPDFDFAHRVRVPDRLTIDNVTLTARRI